MSLPLEQHTITSSCGEYTRDLWVLPSGIDRPHRLCVFLDAEHYLRDMKCLPLLEEIFAAERIPPLTCLFVSHLNGEARHRDFICNRRYARFIAEDLLTWARERERNIEATDNVICGLSLSGLQGAFIAFHYSGTFPRALSQSGSFWWLADHEAEFPRGKVRLWLSVGSEETATNVTHPPTRLFQRVSQVAGVETAARRFESGEAIVRYNLYRGGHAMDPWRDELPVALEWLFSRDSKSGTSNS